MRVIRVMQAIWCALSICLLWEWKWLQLQSDQHRKYLEQVYDFQLMLGSTIYPSQWLRLSHQLFLIYLVSGQSFHIAKLRGLQACLKKWKLDSISIIICNKWLREKKVRVLIENSRRSDYRSLTMPQFQAIIWVKHTWWQWNRLLTILTLV